MLDTNSANRGIAIDCNLSDALAFVSEPTNLPAWTFFFRKVIDREGDRIRFDTPIGECLTKIRTKRGADWATACIHSRFASGDERARLRFTRNVASQTLANFYAMFPAGLPQTQRAAILEQIERELIRLKTILEPEHNHHD